MAKRGRPFKYQSDAEAPVTVSLRIPRDVYEQAQRYVRMHHPMTLTDLLLDGLGLRLETPADPRDIILSDDNTVMQELQGMIQAAVQAELGKLNTFMGSAFDALKRAPAPEPSVEPVPQGAYDSHTIMPEVGETTREVSQPIGETPAGGKAKQADIPSYDTRTYYLGKLCPSQHDYHGSGQSLRRLHNQGCRECERLSKRAAREAKRQATEERPRAGPRSAPTEERPS